MRQRLRHHLEGLARAPDRQALRLRQAAEDDRRENAPLPADQRLPFDIELKPKAENKLEDAERAFKVRLDVRATNDTTETARRKIKITP